MRATQRRCQHCKSMYSYQMSGPGSYKYNNDTYCPSCYKIVLEALSNIPVRFEKVLLPTDAVSPEEFEKLYAEQELRLRETMCGLSFQMVHFGAPVNFTYKELYINNVEHICTTNTDTGEKLVECVYEKDCNTGELVGYYYEYR